MEAILSEILNYKNEIVLIIFVLSFIAFILSLINYIRTSKMIKGYKIIMRGMNNENLEQILNEYIDTMDRVLENIGDLDYDVKNVSDQLDSCIRKTSIVRYNPFDDMGGDQSFSLALLDDKGDGVVLTGLYSRETSLIYAKPLIDSKSVYPLSYEEKQAIKLAT